MKRMCAPLLALSLLAPVVSAAPTRDTAKEKLEALKKKLPEVVGKWSKNYPTWFPNATLVKVRVVRQISPTKAKVSILLGGWNAGPIPSRDQVLTIYLRYYDGSWTSSRYEVSWELKEHESAIRVLMLAIDELGEK